MQQEANGGARGGARQRAVRLCQQARLEHATKALKVAETARLGQERRHQQKMAAAVTELLELRSQAATLQRPWAPFYFYSPANGNYIE